ncbi:MAG: hypothetical protein HC876_23025 [Chloroflexaceae bacterium]|nr:hypothetical protein [Chloroflexaceae bacterium]
MGQPHLRPTSPSAATPQVKGGGVFNEGGSPSFTNVTISGNTAINSGGIFNASSSTATFTNVIISGNTASASTGGSPTSVAVPPPLPMSSSVATPPLISLARCPTSAVTPR